LAIADLQSTPAPVTPAADQQQKECGNCHGSGWIVRDADIGTEQECSSCDGSGIDDDADFVQSAPAPVIAQGEREAFEVFAKEHFFDLEEGEYGYAKWPTKMAWEVWQETRRAALPAQDKDAPTFAERLAAAQQPMAHTIKNAERYLWLRNADNQLHEDDVCVSDDSFNTYFGEDLDAAIDAAMQAQNKGRA
jgi:hypothetical protein